MSTVNDLIQRYIAVWNERDSAARTALIAAALTEDSVYSDPDHAALRGHAELSSVVAQARERFGGLVFTLGTVINVHHDVALFTWRLGAPDGGNPVATGYDFVEIAGDRIRRVVGFFE
ncbi:nuclear transport factor 2 family protein [Actinomadura litoris]|uniref:nuclear transport factor 2 family protein n=1 Tax=Actinomadura litoris TaxID=2678616 RepID=UPI001FA70788|nr:nuclear transport factor 2 family protein [Actinomadura litoris]